MLVFIAVLFIVRPLGLPVVVSEQTKSFIDVIESLKPGSNILIQYDVTVAMYPSTGIPTEIMLRHVMEHPFNVMIVSGGPEGPKLLEQFLGGKGNYNIQEMKGRVYGQDHVYLGYIAGGETMYVSLGSNVHGTVVKDYYGTPIDDLPMMNKINTYKDIDLVIICEAGSDQIDGSVRVWATTYGRKLIADIGSSQYTATLVYYPQLVKGIINGVKGGAEYEYSKGKPGPNIAGSDPLTGLLFLNVGLIILGNILYYSKKRGIIK
jgi:hypothetical protein